MYGLGIIAKESIFIHILRRRYYAMTLYNFVRLANRSTSNYFATLRNSALFKVDILLIKNVHIFITT